MKKHSHCKNNNIACSHHHDHSHQHIHAADENILVAFFLNVFFVFVEIIGGLVTNSFAILSDAVHDFGDCVAIGFAYFLEKYSNKEPDEKYTYGYRRYSLVSATITSVILVVGSIFILAGSIERINKPEQIEGLGMVIIAVFGVVVNGIAVLKTRKGTGMNEKAINLHLLEDVLGWIAVLVGSVLIYFFKWYIIDVILSVVIASFLLFESAKNIKNIFAVFLEKTPENIDVKKFREAVNEIDGVENIHHLHIWSLDGEKTIATMHIQMVKNATLEQCVNAKKYIDAIGNKFDISHLTIQTDLHNECSANKCDL